MKGLLILAVLLLTLSCTTSKELGEKNVKFQKVVSKCLFDGFERDTFKYKTCVKENMPK
jgi:hypothetical protein